MKLKKLVQYGLMATCLLGNAMAMNETLEFPKNAISHHQSILDIKAASKTALAEAREFHIMLGANPSEAHVVGLQAAEEKREREEGIKAPIRLFFVNACEMYGEQTPSAKTPILNADFNKQESWDTILEALMLTGKPFNGVIDKIYFDVSTAKFSRWDEGILAKIAILLKQSGELYIPRAKLASQSSFCDSEIEPIYQQISEAQQDPAQADKFNRPYSYSLNPENIKMPRFLQGGCLSHFGMRDGKTYITNNMNLIYDTIFQSSEIIGRPLKFENFESDKMYPNIGIDYREGPKEIIEQYMRINSFVKVTLEAEKKEAEEIIFNIPTVIGIKENVIHETMLELPPKTATTEISIEKKCVINETALELFPKEIPVKTSIREGYKEVKFPSLFQLKEALLQGRSTINSETDSFSIQSIMGTFFGFKPEVKDFDMKMQCASISKKDNGSYQLFGAFKIMIENSQFGIPITLKSHAYDNFNNYDIFTGAIKVEKNTYIVSDPEELSIIVPIKKRVEKKEIFKAPNAVITTEPVLPLKPSIIRSARYCPSLYLKIRNNAEAIKKIYYDESHNLQDSNSRGLLLEIRRELREAEDIIDTIEDPLTTPHDRALNAIFEPDRLEFMQRYMSAAKKHPELSSWLQKIGFNW